MSTNEPMTQEQLDAIQARVDGATRGPWDCYGDDVYEVFDAGEWVDGDLGGVVVPAVTKLSDAAFIAHARTDIPALLAEVGRLRALTTVDEGTVERAAREAYGPQAWDQLLAAGHGVAQVQLSAHCAMTRAILEAALTPQGEA